MVTAAAVGATGASAFALARPMAIPRPPPAPPVTYFSFHKVGGPAPRGVPLIPLRLNAKGELEGNPEVLGPDGQSILNWYKYCGHAAAPGLSDSYNGDNVLRFFVAEDKIKLGVPIWYKDLLGQPIRPEHFTEPGLGAGFIWRSQGQTGPNVITGSIVRAFGSAAFTKEAPRYLPPAKPLKDDEWERVKTEFLHLTPTASFVAASTYCPHFCCIPGWKEATKLAASVVDPINSNYDGTLKVKGTADDRLFCTCHFSVYHPFQLVKYVFEPEVVKARGGGASAGGGGH